MCTNLSIGLSDRTIPGASRVQLSAISSELLWEQSGRLSKIGSEVGELFALNIASSSNMS